MTASTTPYGVLSSNVRMNGETSIANFINRFTDHLPLVVQQQKGIYASLLVFDDGTEAIAEGELNDTLSVLANFQALQTIADQTRTSDFP
jgi:hypothetical protein